MDPSLVLPHVSASILYDWQNGFIQKLEDGSYSIPVAVKDAKAIVVILDLSGYTRATQLLMDQAEEKHKGALESFNASQYVGTLVKYCLDPLLQLVNTFGGDMLNYGGDALFCIWRESTDSYSFRVKKALQCCIEAAKWIRQHPLLDFDNHVIPLAVHTVIHACEIELLHVGDPHLGRIQCIAHGEEYFRACDLLANAKQDEIVITQETLSLIELSTFSNVSVRTQTNGYSVLLVDSKSKPIPVPENIEMIRDQITSKMNTDQVNNISRIYVDPTIFHRPVGTAEIRQATIAFFRLQYFGEKESFLWSVNELLNTSLQVCNPKTASNPLGIMRQITLDDKGLSIMMLFGVRPATSENPSVTASCVCLKLLDTIKVQKLPFDASCGIATGRIYSGCISNDSGSRLEHAVLGQAVNLAARFMSLAEAGMILCDQVTSNMLMSASMLVSTEPLSESLTIKGFRDPIPAWKVKESIIAGSKQSLVQNQSIGLLVGAVEFHDPKEDLIWQKHIVSRKIDSSNAIHTFTIEGPSGAGKSYTASRISTFCFKNGFTLWNVPTFEIEKSTAFSCVRQLLILIHRLFARNGKCEQLVHELTEIYPEKQGFELICQALNINEKHVAVLRNLQKFVVTNVTTSSVQGSSLPSAATVNSRISPDDILQSATDTILALLNGITNLVDLLVVFDDCQWLDRYSWAILSAIHVQCPKLILICISRPPKEYADPTHQTLYEKLTKSPLTYHIIVGSITFERTKSIIKTKFSQLPIAQLEEMTRRLVEMSSGNAFALDVLLRHVENNFDTNQLSESILSALPKDAKSVFVSQLDNLHPTFQSIVRTAAAIGQMFRLSDILALCDVPNMSLDEIQNKILEWDKFGFMEPLDENKWRFKHCLISFQISSLMTKEERQITLLKIAEYFETILRHSRRHHRKPELLPLLSSFYHTLDEKDNAYRIDCKLASLYYRLQQGYECRKILLQLTRDKKRFQLIDTKTRNKIYLIGVHISFVLSDIALTHLFFRPFVEAYSGIKLKSCALMRVMQFLGSIKELDKMYQPVKNTGVWPISVDQRTEAQKRQYNIFLKTLHSANELPHDPALTLQVHTARFLSCTFLFKLNESFDQRTENLVPVLLSYYMFNKYENAVHLRDYLGISTLDPNKPFMKMLTKLGGMSLEQLENLPFGIMSLLHCLGPIYGSFDLNYYLGAQIYLIVWKIASRHGSFRLQETATHILPNWFVKWIQGTLTKDDPLMIHSRSIQRISEQQPAFSLNLTDSCNVLGSVLRLGAEVYNELLQPVKYEEELKTLPNLDLNLADFEFADEFVRSRAPPLNCTKNELRAQYYTSYYLVYFDLVRGAHESAIDHLERTCSALTRFGGILQMLYAGIACELITETYVVIAFRLSFLDPEETPLPDELFKRAHRILYSFISEFYIKTIKHKKKWQCIQTIEYTCYQMHTIKSVMQLKSAQGCKDIIPLAEKALAMSIKANSQKGEILFRELCMYMKMGLLPRQHTVGKELDSNALAECKMHLDRIMFLYGQSNALWSPRHIKRIAKIHGI